MDAKKITLVRVPVAVSISLLLIATLLSGLQGCMPTRKLAYFQRSMPSEDTVAIASPFVPTIKIGDALSIQVSSLNPEASTYFNPASMTDAAIGAMPTNQLTRTAGYLVGNDGTIKLPLVGQLHVEGMTTTAVSEQIGSKLRIYLKEPTVNVRNLNFRVSVLGEVTRPALFTIPNEQITLPEALGLAGDLTIYGRRDNVLIIREEGGQRIFARLDLTRRDAFKSPYYSLHPNDVVYVEPGKARATSVDRTYQLAPVVTGILSLIAIIATRTR